VLRRAAIAAGCPPGALTAGHVEALDALITSWRGQRWADLPGGVRGTRQRGTLLFTAGHPSELAGRDTEGLVGRD
jgi:tRNA(Ile)-lysidine synthase